MNRRSFGKALAAIGAFFTLPKAAPAKVRTIQPGRCFQFGPADPWVHLTKSLMKDKNGHWVQTVTGCCARSNCEAVMELTQCPKGMRRSSSRWEMDVYRQNLTFTFIDTEETLLVDKSAK